VLSALGSLALIFAASMKLAGSPQMEQAWSHLGLPGSMATIAILDLTCLAVYLIPRLSVLGAVLLTGYLGGAICSHWRVGDSFVFPLVVGILIWAGLLCREPRLREIFPILKK